MCHCIRILLNQHAFNSRIFKDLQSPACTKQQTTPGTFPCWRLLYSSTLTHYKQFQGVQWPWRGGRCPLKICHPSKPNWVKNKPVLFPLSHGQWYRLVRETPAEGHDRLPCKGKYAWGSQTRDCLTEEAVSSLRGCFPLRVPRFQGLLCFPCVLCPHWHSEHSLLVCVASLYFCDSLFCFLRSFHQQTLQVYTSINPIKLL